MKLKIFISGKYVYVPAEFATDFVNALNEVCVNAGAQEKNGEKFEAYEPLALEMRAE